MTPLKNYTHVFFAKILVFAYLRRYTNGDFGKKDKKMQKKLRKKYFIKKLKKKKIFLHKVYLILHKILKILNIFQNEFLKHIFQKLFIIS